ncbi:MAG: hypothetical protein IKW88_03175 [Clostridiales bacterium]|nr:hypothetical protein [Clostridiales bacterium]
MKSTYKLFGIYWDHKTSIDFDDCNVIQGNEGIDYKQQFCLFDFVGEYRTINISELICIENSLEFDTICNKLRGFSRIAINIDFITSHNSILSSKFYKKRICQIIYALQNELPDSLIVVQVPCDKTSEWNALKGIAS